MQDHYIYPKAEHFHPCPPHNKDLEWRSIEANIVEQNIQQMLETLTYQ